ncbi:hypothetical protein DYB37_000235 [Aphanomyces astaci]|uniref:t-SNARE coiled-coil homology domain-containing protein n=1 Tax=Aphanomyces astaci TaxID=112090 RepID=A0A3L6V3K6_APHAT|nr:hypothetical protein DYB35_000946 [Aphanomyces astaci]RHZ18077.1 hypothetical protein DYB37_000235 [Aphanomyces astaci]RLO03317.1 hypothetical protein DYB28_010437 [Aphanomyces astaci]
MQKIASFWEAKRKAYLNPAHFLPSKAMAFTDMEREELEDVCTHAHASVLDSYKLCEQRVGELKLLVFPAHGIPQQVVKVRSEVVHYLRVEKQVHDIQGMMHQFASEIGGQAEKMHVVAQEAEAAADNVGHGNLSLKHAADHGHGFGFAIFCCYLAASTLLLFFHYY